MASPAPSIPGPISLDRSPLVKLLGSVARFLVRRRILLSGIVFGVLAVNAVAYGPKPHDLIDFRDPLSVLGSVLVLSGLGLRSLAAGILRKDAELTTTGPYKLIRNPLYVGSFLMLCGFCALIGDLVSFGVVLLPMLVIYGLKVRQEERLLSKKFPTQWIEYSRSTPRFIPRLRRVDLTADWRLRQWMFAREYKAFGATLAAMLAIEIWRVI